MKAENERLIIDGNTIYELDLECVRRKERAGRGKQGPDQTGQRRSCPGGSCGCKKSGQRN